MQGGLASDIQLTLDTLPSSDSYKNKGVCFIPQQGVIELQRLGLERVYVAPANITLG